MADAAAAEPQLKVGPRRRWTGQVPPATAFHSVGAIQAAVGIKQDRPGQLRLLRIRPREVLAFKRHHGNLHVAPIEFFLPLSQLRQMIPARQSGQVAMEDQKQPVTTKVVQAMALAANIKQIEVDSRLVYAHSARPLFVIIVIQVAPAVTLERRPTP